MSYQLAGMAEAWEFDSLRHYPSDLGYLPDFPHSVSEDELDYCNGVDDAKSYMQGLIDCQQSCNSHYMRGWAYCIENYFTNQELFGKKVDNSLVKK